jgi:alpha-ketoglutarate-dependent taurine dioxygenase
MSCQWCETHSRYLYMNGQAFQNVAIKAAHPVIRLVPKPGQKPLRLQAGARRNTIHSAPAESLAATDPVLELTLYLARQHLSCWTQGAVMTKIRSN